MKKTYSLFILTIISSFFSFGQINRYGIPFVKNISSSETHASEQNWSVVQDNRGIIYVANNEDGVLEYDGTTWRKISVPNNVALRDLCVDDQGVVYVGGDKEFGYLEPDNKGRLHYHSLSTKLDSADRHFNTIYHTYFWQGAVCFSSTRIVYKYYPSSDSIAVYPLKKDGFENGNYSFIANNRYFLGDAAAGLLSFDGEHFHLVKNGSFFSFPNIQSAILSVLPYNQHKILVATYKAGVYSYDLRTGEINGNVFSATADNYLKKNRFYDGKMLPDSTYAMATLNGGLVIIKHNGEMIQILNRGEGLDNETVTKIFLNNSHPESSQLWLALYIGLAQVEWFSPFRYFSEDNGFKGSVNDIVVVNEKLYLATSTGVFVRSYDKTGVAHFIRIPEINAQAWSFLYFNVPGIQGHLLWVGTEEGIYNISDNGRATLVEKQIINLKPRERRFYVFKLFASPMNPSRVFIGTGKDLIILIHRNNHWYIDTEIKYLQDAIRSITEDREGNIWFSLSYQGIARLYNIDTGSYHIIKYGKNKGLPQETGNSVTFANNRLLVLTARGLYSYQKETDTLVPETFLGEEYANGSKSVQTLYAVSDSLYYLNASYPDGSFHVEEVRLKNDHPYSLKTPFYRLPPQSAYAFAREDSIIWTGISNRIYSYNPDFKKNYQVPFHTLIRKITIGEDSLLFAGAFYKEDIHGRRHLTLCQTENHIPEIKYAFNNLTFHWACPFFEGHNRILYSFRLKDFDRNWSKWTDRTEYPYTNIPNGNFKFEVKAKNIYGEESSVGSFSFTILAPWYLTFWAFLIYLILVFFLIVIIVKLYTRRLQNEKIRLEGIVADRTAEVVRQKEELTDSITYASRIQRAVLPSERLLNEQFPDHFILFKPRDIVSGDFYWITKQNDVVLVTAADCTGHGVPGAFMSLLGISFLNEIVNRSDIIQPNQILDELRSEVMQSLKQRGKEGETKDGMDMALVSIDKKKKKLFFAGAYNPLYYVRALSQEEKEKINNGENPGFGKGSVYDKKYVLIQINADKMPIGISVKDEQPFTLHEINFTPGDRIFLSSDGYLDQFGGPLGKKFMSRNFKKLIVSMQDSLVKEQGKLLDKHLLEWKGKGPQIDDIIVIGIKL